jgi:hypothetical protein
MLIIMSATNLNIYRWADLKASESILLIWLKDRDNSLNFWQSFTQFITYQPQILNSESMICFSNTRYKFSIEIKTDQKTVYLKNLFQIPKSNFWDQNGLFQEKKKFAEAHKTKKHDFLNFPACF